MSTTHQPLFQEKTEMQILLQAISCKERHLNYSVLFISNPDLLYLNYILTLK